MESQIYHATQFGSGDDRGLLMYRPAMRRQHGHGIGSFFRSLFRTLMPLAKQYVVPAVKDYVLPHAASAVRNVAQDLVNGENLRESLKSNARGVLKGVASQVFSQKGSGLKRRRKHKSTSGPRKSIKRRRTTSKKPKKYTSKKKRQFKKSDFITLFD